MTDALKQAKAICNATVLANLEKEPEVCLESAKLLPKLVAECERLQANQCESGQCYESHVGDRLQDELARWQKIAIEERYAMLCCQEYEPPRTERSLREQAAREICTRLRELHAANRVEHPEVSVSVSPLCDEKQVYETIDLANKAALELPAALDEIERLQEIDRHQNKSIIELIADNNELKNQLRIDRQTIDAYRSQNIEQAKRIAELESTQKQLSELVSEKENVTIVISQEKELADLERKLVESNHRCLDLQYMLDTDTAMMDKQRAALKKLGQVKRERGKALVEERAKDGSKIPELCDIVHDELMCPALDGDCRHWEVCPQKGELRKNARQQLRQEGLL